jgi:sporulation protein YhbH
MDISNIQQDHSRFREIIRGKIKQELRKYISKGELIGKKGKDIISIPVPQIEIPHFRLGAKQMGGVGQGDGEEGDPLGGEQGEGSGSAGDQPGEHILEVDIEISTLAEILGEELELPRIKPKGKDIIESIKTKFTGIHKVGPQSLKHFRRTYKQALKRTISGGLYNHENPVVVPVREDFRYRSWKEEPMPKSNAVIIYMMDVSGSMGDEQKELVRIESFWIDTWIRSQYKGLDVRYIIHDATAREVDRETFFHTKESGGTMISSAYRMCREIIKAHYPDTEWNIYPFHFSDGDNWSGDDSQVCVNLLKQDLLPSSNIFCYGQVDSPYGSGQFLNTLKESFEEEEKLITSQIHGKESVVDSIKTFLGKGK